MVSTLVNGPWKGHATNDELRRACIEADFDDTTRLVIDPIESDAIVCGDPARLVTRQVIFGEMASYWTQRPLRSLADLDEQLPATELLNQAFGHAEGGLLWPAGKGGGDRGRGVHPGLGDLLDDAHDLHLDVPEGRPKAHPAAHLDQVGVTAGEHAVGDRLVGVDG